MSTMDLLTIPGLDNSAKLQEMYAASKKRMRKGVERQMVGVAMMNYRNSSKKESRKESR